MAIPAQRQQNIINYLNSNYSITVQQAADLNHVSIATTRRDLDELGRIGLLRRTHGGGVLNDQDSASSELFHNDKMKLMVSEKSRIAEKAAQIDTLNADIADKAAQIDMLNTAVADKTAQIEVLNADMETLQKAQTDSAFQAEELKKLFMKTFGASPANTMANLEGNENVEVIRRFRIREDDNPNARSFPGIADGNILGHATASQEYTILDVSDNGWYLIRLDSGKTAWVNGKMGTVVEIGFNFPSDAQDAAAEGGE